uniref:Uncharacterized protein n=1 Tax=Panagrolaimus davidi TaxID=227884 RepID=A0A914PC39_9BILA
MPFDILSQECAKIFEPIKKDKLNALFYFIYKRDIWFALQTVTNGSIAETFSLACACADISPIILLQICSFMAPIREGRYLDRRPSSSFMPGECPNVPEIQASTKTWVNLISLRFNNLLPPKPNNISFDVSINVFYQLGLNNLKEQATDLKSAMQMFFSLKQPPVFKGDFAPPFLDFPFFPLAAPGFALDYENPVYRQFAFLRTLYSNPVFDNSVWTSSQPSRNEDIRSRIENNSTANFNNSNQYLLSSASTSSTSSTSSPLNNVFGNSQFPNLYLMEIL